MTVMRRWGPLAALLAAVFAIVLLGAHATGPAPDASPRAGAASPTPTLTPTPAPNGPVVRRLMALQRAYNAGDVRRLCRPGDFLDRAVVAHLHEPGVVDCEADVEELLRTTGDMDITVGAVRMRPDLATAMVSAGGAAAVPVDVVRHGRRWLVSFSDGGDPLQAMAGT